MDPWMDEGGHGDDGLIVEKRQMICRYQLYFSLTFVLNQHLSKVMLKRKKVSRLMIMIQSVFTNCKTTHCQS